MLASWALLASATWRARTGAARSSRGSAAGVPATSFCEYTDGQPKVPHWFALGADRPLFAFARIWRPWTGARGTKAERKALADETGSENREHLLFGFLTTDANDVVRPIHAKAMPVILTGEECDTWLEADVDAVLKLQRPLPAERSGRPSVPTSCSRRVTSTTMRSGAASWQPSRSCGAAGGRAKA
jgi:putative SOS response-associated peptidase YedK